MMDLADVTLLNVRKSVFLEGYEFLRAAGAAGLEGLLLWAGKQDGTIFSATRLLIPSQRGIRTADGVCAVVDQYELHRLNVLLYKEGLDLAAQVHTHPGRAYHSTTDDMCAVATTIGSFSIVVPNFAVRNYPLSDCAIYRLQKSGEWREVDESALPNQIVVVEH